MLLEIIYYASIGIIAGTLSGLLGIGGGVLVVPLLAFVFSIQMPHQAFVMHIAVATSLASMLATAPAAVFAHHRRGIHFWPIYRLLAPGVVLGAIFGAALAHKLSTFILKIIFAVFVSLVAIYLLLNRPISPHRQLPKKNVRFIISTLIGTQSGLLGTGGGSITIPFLTYCNVNMRVALAASAACSFTIAFFSTLSFMLLGTTKTNLPQWSTGYIYWPAVLSIAIVSPWFAQLGAWLSHRLPIVALRRIFAFFLLLVAIHMFNWHYNG